ncbi:MAG TPA: hypothetical protein EYH03_01555 [Chromatiales bacterium]|nr:hypothetical protein [Chromatiales bacterium]
MKVTKQLCLSLLVLFSMLYDVQAADYRSEMRAFVQAISRHARAQRSDFIVIPQNGAEIVTFDGTVTGEPVKAYLDAIDGIGQEDLFFGYDKDDVATPKSARKWIMGFLDIYKKAGRIVLVTDYCHTHGKVDQSIKSSEQRGYIPFPAPKRDLNAIPDYPAEPVHGNRRDITKLSDAANFLYIINPERYKTKKAFIDAVSVTNYDAVIVDAFFNDSLLVRDDIARLQYKRNGGRRLVIAYMSIGEAEDYRFYWRNEWKRKRPSWLGKENPRWKGNYKVRYWEKGWQSIIYDSRDAYLQKILDAGFDGVYLDIIDAFEYFEKNEPSPSSPVLLRIE